MCSIAAGETQQEAGGDSRRSVRDSILAAASDIIMGEDIAGLALRTHSYFANDIIPFQSHTDVKFELCMNIFAFCYA